MEKLRHRAGASPAVSITPKCWVKSRWAEVSGPRPIPDQLCGLRQKTDLSVFSAVKYGKKHLPHRAVVKIK